GRSAAAPAGSGAPRPGGAGRPFPKGRGMGTGSASGDSPHREAMLAAMSLYDKRLVIVSGKGGVGKSTVSAAVGMAAAGHGLQTLLVEVASQERMSLLFDQGGPIGYHA